MTGRQGEGSLDIRDDRARGRFVFESPAGQGELVYRLQPGRLVVLHTGVPEALRRGGLGGRLVEAALDRARSEGLTIVPRCGFARWWLQQHPDVVPSSAVDWDAPAPVPRH